MSKHEHLNPVTARQLVERQFVKEERRMGVGPDPEIGKAERAKRRAVGKRQRAARKANR